MFVAYRYRLYPTEAQKVLINKTFGCCRYVYNKALSLKITFYEKEKKTLSRFVLDKMMTDWKRGQDTWHNEVSSQALQASLINLEAAYSGFFEEGKRLPKFKNRGNHKSFGNPQHTKVCFVAKKVYIPKFREGISCVFHRRFDGTVRSSTVSCTSSGNYYISILVEDGKKEPAPVGKLEKNTLGIDLGIKTFLTASDGQKILKTKDLNQNLDRLKTIQRRMGRKTKGSKNYEKSRIKVAKLHEKISNCRKDFLHKVTASLVKNQNFDSFAIEDMSIQKMRESRDKSMSRNIEDAGWGYFRTFLEYKAKRAGKNVMVIGRFDPSSRLCNCGYHNSLLTLKDRFWTCPSCGETHDRDVLAARNIVKFAFLRQDTAKDSSESTAKTEVLACKLSDTSNSVSNLGSERPDCLSQSSLKAPPKKRNKKSNMPVEGRKTRLKQEIPQIYGMVHKELKSPSNESIMNKNKILVWFKDLDSCGDVFYEAPSPFSSDGESVDIYWRIRRGTLEDGKTLYYADSDSECPDICLKGSLRELKRAIQEKHDEIIAYYNQEKEQKSGHRYNLDINNS